VVQEYTPQHKAYTSTDSSSVHPSLGRDIHKYKQLRYTPVKQRHIQVQATVVHTITQGRVQTMKTYGTTIQWQTYKQAVEMYTRAWGPKRQCRLQSNTGSSQTEETLI